jgi:hypothetical protein
VLWLAGVGCVAFLAALTVGHGDWVVAAYGTRILVLHMPLIFLFGLVFTRDDAWRFGKALLIMAIPMVVLMGFQYSLPQTHWVNIAPGGEASMSISGALDKYRSTGSFSHSTGLGNFVGLSAAFLFAWLVAGPRPLPVWLWGSSAALILAVPLSISRAIIFYYVLILGFGTLGCLLAGRAVKNLAVAFVLLAITAFAVANFEIFKDSTATFKVRWEGAEASEGEGEGLKGVLRKRIGGTLIVAWNGIMNEKFFGHGIGLGTNVGAVRKTGGKVFLLAEGALPVIVSELGPPLGVALILWRLGLALKLFRLAFRESVKRNILPMTLAGMSIQILIFGQTSQPTILGFLVVCAGLTLASCNRQHHAVAVEDPAHG